MGEIAGYLYLNIHDSLEGVGGIKLNIYKGNSLVASIVSQPDGYFSYLGLPSGKYLVQPDLEQLEKLGLKTGEGMDISISNGEDGALIDTLEFVLHKI